MRFVNRDGTPWSWRTAAPRFAALATGAALSFRYGFDLSWSGTIAALVAAFGGAALVWGFFFRLSRRGPLQIVLPADSLRARLLVGEPEQHQEAAASCGHCGWSGTVRQMTRVNRDDSTFVVLCPSCGEQIARSATAADLAQPGLRELDSD